MSRPPPGRPSHPFPPCLRRQAWLDGTFGAVYLWPDDDGAPLARRALVAIATDCRGRHPGALPNPLAPSRPKLAPGGRAHHVPVLRGCLEGGGGRSVPLAPTRGRLVGVDRGLLHASVAARCRRHGVSATWSVLPAGYRSAARVGINSSPPGARSLVCFPAHISAPRESASHNFL